MHTLFKRILFCGDFTKGAHTAFQLVEKLTKIQPDCTLYLLHIIPEPEAQFWKSYLYEVEGIDQKARDDIFSKIQEEYPTEKLDNITCHTDLRIGSECDEVLQVAQEKQIDLIVIGRHGSGLIARTLAQHVAEKIIRKAACPVLVVPPKE